jgi:hypothetical protein
MTFEELNIRLDGGNHHPVSIRLFYCPKTNGYGSTPYGAIHGENDIGQRISRVMSRNLRPKEQL